MEIYNQLRSVPIEAQKKITAGRLNGFTDINPMWRIKKLTELFGVCGFGWKTNITKKEIVVGADGNISAFIDIELFIKQNNEWSEPIIGIGGSSFVAKEKNGLYQSDECFKMAYTDAISVATKMLGLGADIYFEKDKTKYTNTPEEPKTKEKNKIKNINALLLIFDKPFPQMIGKFEYKTKLDLFNEIVSSYDLSAEEKTKLTQKLN